MTDLRRCIGSTKFGIEAHEAPVEDFPSQRSQKDGLGRMCKTHWNQYTSALRKAALARKAAEPAEATEVAAAKSDPAVAAPKGSRGRKAKGAEPAKPEPIPTRAPLRRAKAEPVAEVEPEPFAG